MLGQPAGARFSQANTTQQLATLLSNSGGFVSQTIDLVGSHIYQTTLDIPSLVVPSRYNVTISCHGASFLACDGCRELFHVSNNASLVLNNCTLYNSGTLPDTEYAEGSQGEDAGSPSPAAAPEPPHALLSDNWLERGATLDQGSFATFNNCGMVLLAEDCEVIDAWQLLSSLDNNLMVGKYNDTYLQIVEYKVQHDSSGSAYTFSDTVLKCLYESSPPPVLAPPPRMDVAPVVAPALILPQSPAPEHHDSAFGTLKWLIGVGLGVVGLLSLCATIVMLLWWRRHKPKAEDISEREIGKDSMQKTPRTGLPTDVMLESPYKGPLDAIRYSAECQSSSLRSSVESTLRTTLDAFSNAILELKQELHAEQLQIHDIIAQGGFGTVYRGTWRGLKVAVKTVLFQGTVVGSDSMQRAATEASIAYNLTHNNIVATYSHELKPVSDQPHPSELPAWKLYLIQELCNGGTLSNLVESGALRGKHGGTRFNRVMSLLVDIAYGMEHLHRMRIAHGDLNPNNILLTVDRGEEGNLSARRGAGWRMHAHQIADALDAGKCCAKITDFGLSIRLGAGRTHASNINQGTPFYCAPELTEQARLSRESDVFSYGVIMWELANGCAPYVTRGGIFERHPKFPSFPRSTPVEYALLSLSCMYLDPDERPTFQHILQELSGIFDGMLRRQNTTCFQDEDAFEFYGDPDATSTAFCQQPPGARSFQAVQLASGPQLQAPPPSISLPSRSSTSGGTYNSSRNSSRSPRHPLFNVSAGSSHPHSPPNSHSPGPPARVSPDRGFALSPNAMHSPSRAVPDGSPHGAPLRMMYDEDCSASARTKVAHVTHVRPRRSKEKSSNSASRTPLSVVVEVPDMHGDTGSSVLHHASTS